MQPSLQSLLKVLVSSECHSSRSHKIITFVVLSLKVEAQK